MRKDDRSPREIAKALKKKAGDDSADLALKLMKLSDAQAKRLVVDEDLRDAIDRARRVTTHVARRRAERTLAGDLRRFELGDLEAQLQQIDGGSTDIKQFHEIEQWRARLIEDDAALAEFPAADDELPRLISAARRERDTGKPPGAARALFRHVAKLLG